MKKILLLPAMALTLAATSCTSSTHEESTTVVDTGMGMAPATAAPADTMTATPSTEANGMAPADNTHGGISTGESGATTRGGTGTGSSKTGTGSSKTGTGANTGAGMSNTATPDVGANSGNGKDKSASQKSTLDNPKSTYPKAKPGAPVDSRMPEGTSR